MNKALGGDPLTVAGDGSQARRFVYVEDLADGVVRALAPEAANRVYNLAGSETTTILEIAQTVQELVGDAEIVHTEARAGDFGGKEVSSERALDELGWQPVTPFAEGARRYVVWRRERDAAAASADWSRCASGSRRRLRGGRRCGRWSPRCSSPPGSSGASRATTGCRSSPRQFPGTKPVTGVDTASPQVGLIVDAPASIAPAVAKQLASQGASASIALTRARPDQDHRRRPKQRQRRGPAPAAGRPAALDRHARSDPPGREGSRHQRARLLRRAGDRLHARSGPARATAGATPVSGSVKVPPNGGLGVVERGDLIEISVNSEPGWRAWLDSLCRQVHERRLTAVSAATLLRTGPGDR